MDGILLFLAIDDALLRLMELFWFMSGVLTALRMDVNCAGVDDTLNIPPPSVPAADVACVERSVKLVAFL